MKPVTLPLLETLEWTAVPHQLFVNGFDTDALVSVSGNDGQVIGFATRMYDYSVLHPYFLKQGSNELRADYHLDLSFMVEADQGPWKLAVRVASTSYAPGGERDQKRAETPLLTLTSPTLPKNQSSAAPHTMKGSFTWAPPVPTWGWTHGVKIDNTPATRASLFAEYQKIFASFDAEWSGHKEVTDEQRDAFEKATRASTAEFTLASELFGRRFTFLDQLFVAARTLNASSGPAASTTKNPKKPRAPIAMPMDDGPGIDDYDLAGPRLQLESLGSVAELKLVVFAEGHLAKLTRDHGLPVLSYFSNRHDGPWGAQGTSKISAELWFRRNKAGTWELDAVYPMTDARLGMSNAPLPELLQRQGL